MRKLALVTQATWLPVWGVLAGMPAVAAELPLYPPLLITEIKIDNDYNSADGSGYDEFIELYNASDTQLSLDAWELYYANVYDVVAMQPTRERTLPLDGIVLEPGQFHVVAKEPEQISGSTTLGSITLNNTVGTIMLKGPDPDNPDAKLVYDGISWAAANGSQPVPEGVAPVPDKSRSLQRFAAPFDQELIFEEAWTAAVPTPFSYVTAVLPEEDPEDETGDEPKESEGEKGEEEVLVDPDEAGLDGELTCEGVVISELLPNPAGADKGREFVELYNPGNETIPLMGCMLQTSANAKTYTFPDIVLQPGSYYAIYDSASGLTLPNGAGGTVWLIAPGGTELYEVIYPADLDDDQAWVIINGEWRQTYAVTPNAPNELAVFKPCPTGQERNPQTNRCVKTQILAAATPRTTATASSLAPCKDGQERNPATNRCRAVTASASALKPCAANQYRNPETNRCKLIESVASLSACPAGQERNPETNRCRKVASIAADGFANVEDIISEPEGFGPTWILAGTAAALAVSYGLYEWRFEARRLTVNLRQKFTFSRQRD